MREKKRPIPSHLVSFQSELRFSSLKSNILTLKCLWFGVRGRDRQQTASSSTTRRTAVRASRGGQADQKSTDIAAVTLWSWRDGIDAPTQELGGCKRVEQTNSARPLAWRESHPTKWATLGLLVLKWINKHKFYIDGNFPRTVCALTHEPHHNLEPRLADDSATGSDLRTPPACSPACGFDLDLL